MKKLINDPEAFADEVVEAVLLAHPSHLKRAAETHRGLVRADHAPRMIGDDRQEHRSFAFQVGYMRGLFQAVELLAAGKDN